MDQLTLSCPNCAQPVGESDRYCEECGIDLSAAQPTAAAALAPATAAHAGAGAFAAGDPTGAAHSAGPTGTAGLAGAGASGHAEPSRSASDAFSAGTPGAAGVGGPAGAPGRAGAFGAGDPASAAHSAGLAGADDADGLGRPTSRTNVGVTGGAGTPGAGGHGEPGHAFGAGAPGASGHGEPGHAFGAGAPGASGHGGSGHAFGAPGAAAPVPSGATGDFVLAAPLLATEGAEPEGAEAGVVADPWSGVPVGDGRVCVGCGAQRIDTDGYCEVCGLAQPRPRDHQERALNGVCGVSDRGHRHHRNEDAFAVAATSRPDGVPAVVAVVCDGVSSATRPDDASQAAADSASEALLEALEAGVEPEAAMTAAIMTAAARVDELADEFEREPSRNAPACTIVSAVLTEGRVTVGWVGDSRAYWFPDDRSGSQRLTVDDSWATRMVEAGLMSEAEAFADPRAHAITGWLGADAIEVEPHVTTFVPQAPGTVLVCTDGLWNYAEAAADLAAVVPADARTKPLQAAQTLARYACDRGGHDNITVALLPVDRVEPPEPTLPDHPPTLVGHSLDDQGLDSPTIQLREGES